MNLCRAVERSGEFDVIHAHAYLWGLPLESLSRAPMVHTLHTAPTKDEFTLWSMHPDAIVTGISHQQWSASQALKPAAVIHHGLDVQQFDFVADPSDYVCFLGRFIPQKGPLHAIAVARQLGLRLILAGESNAYFEKTVAPHVDGKQIQYIGAVDSAQRNELLGHARALLYPNEAGEPFGLVMPEAMLCGTPVVAMSVGAVPEIVDEAITGYFAADLEGFSRCVLRSFLLDRKRIREHAKARFSAARMAEGYERVFEQAVGRSKGVIA
jgi:glycosyltransferase involved in cell wall biosynthesis